jgi:hypothetical protein
LNPQNPHPATILVTDDVEETRDGIERLLEADGYQVDPARDEADAIERAGSCAHRIRRLAGLTDDVPVVIFCVPTIEEGAEVALGRNIFATRPDNFDQLRRLLGRILSGVPPLDRSPD